MRRAADHTVLSDSECIRSLPNAWTLRRTSVHEAGHSVIARLLGLDCGGASIVSTENRSGYSHINTKFASPAQACIVSMAGPAAERELLRRHGLPTDDTAFDKYDQHRIAVLIDRHRLNDTDVARFERMARDLVQQHYDSIRRVAAALRKYRLLGASEIDKLLTEGVSHGRQD